MQPSVRVRDARALRALAHPLRGRLLGLLRIEGPSTATLLGRRLGESSGATSYHLRQLAAWGFVEEVPDRGTGRERWWQAVHRSTSWLTSDFADDEGRAAADELQRHLVDGQHRVLDAWSDQQGRLPRPYDEAASLNDWVLRLSPEQTRALADELTAVVERYAAGPQGGELVTVLADVLPLAEHPT